MKGRNIIKMSFSVEQEVHTVDSSTSTFTSLFVYIYKILFHNPEHNMATGSTHEAPVVKKGKMFK